MLKQRCQETAARVASLAVQQEEMCLETAVLLQERDENCKLIDQLAVTANLFSVPTLIDDKAALQATAARMRETNRRARRECSLLY